MKKFLLSLCAAAMGVCSLVAAEQTVTFDFATKDYGLTRGSEEYNVTPLVITEGDVTMTIDPRVDNAGGARLWTKGMRFYKSSAFTMSVENGVLTKIEINGAKTSFDADNYADGVWEGALASVKFACNISKSNAEVTSIVVTYDNTGAAKLDPTLVFSETAVTAVVGEEFTAPTLTKETPADAVYSSSNKEVATVDSITGAVTILALGTTEITATTEATEEYSAGVASYTITVIPADLITTMLNGNSEGWEIENITIPEGATYVWNWDSYGYYKASGYIGGAACEAAARVISPVIDLAGRENCFFTFEQAAKFQTTLKELCKAQVREEGAEDWTDLAIAEWPEAGAWTFAGSGEISLKEFDGKKIQIAFYYGSSTEGADTWEVKNLTVCGDKVETAIEVVEAVAEEGEAIYYNLQGVRVANPDKGLFIKVQGKKATKIIR